MKIIIGKDMKLTVFDVIDPTSNSAERSAVVRCRLLTLDKMPIISIPLSFDCDNSYADFVGFIPSGFTGLLEPGNYLLETTATNLDGVSVVSVDKVEATKEPQSC